MSVTELLDELLPYAGHVQVFVRVGGGLRDIRLESENDENATLILVVEAEE